MDKNVSLYRENFRKTVVPKYYWPLGHVLFNFTGLIFLCVYCLMQLDNPAPLEWLVLPLMMIQGNISVYLIHKYPLHRRLPLIAKHTYDIHSKMHHQFYTNDAIIYEEPKDFYILFFPSWTIIAFAIIQLPLMYFALIPFLAANIVWMILFGASLYFLLYEVLHYISHLPENHFIVKLKPFRYMWRHHRVHHNPKLMRDWNFNVVWPLCDWLFKTTYKDKNP